MGQLSKGDSGHCPSGSQGYQDNHWKFKAPLGQRHSRREMKYQADRGKINLIPSYCPQIVTKMY